MGLRLTIKRKEVIKFMKAIRILGRTIRDAFKSVWRNFSLSIASITCIAITLILVAMALVISDNVNHFTEKLENELSIVVYLNEDTTSEQASSIQDDIKKMASYQKLTAKAISEINGVKSAKYGEDTVDQMVVVFRVVERATLVIVAALILVTTFLISNTIKLTIYSRRNEIEIMRLVGTSNSVIKLPFIFEG